MAEQRASYIDFQSFLNPCYTYVLKIPVVPGGVTERTLQRALGPRTASAILDSGSPTAHAPEPTDEEGYCAWLEINGPNTSYMRTLCHLAHNAAYDEFKYKQGTRKPTCSIFTQSEIGRSPHVHLILGGEGLNKYNAKGYARKVNHRFWNKVEEEVNKNCPEPDEAEQQLLKIIKNCKQDAAGDNKLCSILTYKTRRGDSFACRVDGPEMCINYFLPKLMKWFSMIVPAASTPLCAYFFKDDGKSYAWTTMNGKDVCFKDRKAILEALEKGTGKGLMEPVYDGTDGLPQVQTANWDSIQNGSSKMTKQEALMLGIMQICTNEFILTYEELVQKHPEQVVMIESRPGGSKRLEQLLRMTHMQICNKYTALTFIQARFTERTLTPENKAIQLLTTQGYNPWQVGHWLCCMLNKESGKQNTLGFYGPANTGKTNFAKALVNAVKLFGCVNHQNINFIFNDCPQKLIIWWEEALMDGRYVEQAKCLLGGTSFRIDKKHSESTSMGKTPVIISTNNDLYTVQGGNTTSHVHAAPLKARIVQLDMFKQLPSTFGEISELDVTRLINACADRFTPTLHGFLQEWGIETVPHKFPQAKLCETCSQDFTLFETGVCDCCGHFKPLRCASPTYTPEEASTSAALGKTNLNYFKYLLI